MNRKPGYAEWVEENPLIANTLQSEVEADARIAKLAEAIKVWDAKFSQTLAATREQPKSRKAKWEHEETEFVLDRLTIEMRQLSYYVGLNHYGYEPFPYDSVGFNLDTLN